MDSSKLNDWMQIVGMFAIVASLIFVGLQMKQSQEIAIAAQYQSRAETAMDLHQVGMEIGWSRASARMTPIEEVSSDRFHVRVSAILWGWINLDNNHYQYQAGFMSDEAWINYERRIQRLHANCSMRWVYETFQKGFVRASFLALVDSMNDPCSPEDAIPPWEKANILSTVQE